MEKESKMNGKDYCRDTSILDDMKLIYSKSAESALSNDFFNRPGKVHEKLNRLSTDLNITPLQVVLLTIILENNHWGAKLKDISSHTGCYYMELLSHLDDIRFLLSKGYLMASDNNDLIESRYTINEAALLYWGRNFPCKFDIDEHMAYRHIIDFLEDKYYAIEENMNSSRNLKKDVEYILGLYKDTFLPKRIYSMITSNTNRWYATCTILYSFLCNQINHPGPTYDELYKSLFDSYSDERMREIKETVWELRKNKIIKVSKKGQIELIKDQLRKLELNSNNKKEEKDAIKLPVNDEEVFKKLCDDSCTLISIESIIEKQLFFNDEEEKKLSELSRLLSHDSYMEVVNRLSESGLGTGLNCLLYGGPGTGKTEFVYQVARKCGRSIMIVDFSTLRNRYVGDSEKAIRKVFSTYRTLVEKCDVTPILLLNECDGLLGKRVEVTESTDQLNNACQAILLEELESLKGISFSTSNIPQRMDEAFERRFLYKVEFHNPNATTRKRIWMSLYNNLPECDASIVAKNFELSGGQISNVVKKINIHTILHGKDSIGLEKIMVLCGDEAKSYKRGLKSGQIGFIAKTKTDII